MKAHIFILLLLIFVIASCTNQNDNDIEIQIKKLETERFQAMIQIDTVSLNRILADNLTYTHTNSWLQTKEELIASLESRELNYKSAIINDMVVRAYETSAVVTGTATMKVESHEQEYNLQIRFIDVYVKKNANWQMVAWQSTCIPAD